MKYLKVAWNHSFSNEPILLYSELNDESWEIRKVEVFRDGRLGYAEADRKTPGTRLSVEPIPPPDYIAEDPQFELLPVDKIEFEEIWEKATAE